VARWTPEHARAWWAEIPWICGFNFLPSSAVNFLEMWHEDSFDPATISRELGWAAGIGFNAIRVNLHPLVWAHDRDGLVARLDRVMGEAARQGIRTVPCLFDDCGFGGAEPVYGPQPDPVEGVHNSRAVASPGRAAVTERGNRPVLESYLRDIVSTFRDDPRVLFWDLYNEPGNRMTFGPDRFWQHDAGLAPHSLALMEAAFGWARAEAPGAPLTAGAWSTPEPGSGDAPYRTDIDRRAIDLSDIVTFHAYCDSAQVSRLIDYLARHARPLLCTEWMARSVGSRIADQLALFRDRNVGCFQWGLVKGRTQTHLPWPDALVRQHGGQPDRSIWFHDLLHADGRPYDADEVATIRALTGLAAPRRSPDEDD